LAEANDHIDSISSHGAQSKFLAIGLYSWSDLNNGNDESLPFLTNEQCERFLSAISSQADVKSNLAEELARVLPALSTGISFIGSNNIRCGPKVAHQTRGDQQAVFEVTSMQISAFYLYFASGATYVTYADTTLDRSAQLAEASALLGKAAVRVALQDALRRVFLATLRDDYGLFSRADKPTITQSVQRRKFSKLSTCSQQPQRPQQAKRQQRRQM
jgi:hypothetical protein